MGSRVLTLYLKLRRKNRRGEPSVEKTTLLGPWCVIWIVPGEEVRWKTCSITDCAQPWQRALRVSRTVQSGPGML